MQTNTAFHKHLRSALNHFYDHDYLRQCPLAADLRIAERFDVPSALRKILADAIDFLKPAPAVPVGSTPHQLHDVLLYRYVQQFEQDEVAHHLGVSERHMRRIQEEALDELACYLWDKYQLQDVAIKESVSTDDPANLKGNGADWSWLKGTPPERVSDTRQALAAIVELTRPLAAQNRVRLELVSEETISDLAVHPVALRQIMLNLLGVAMHHAQDGTINLHIAARGPFVLVRVDTQSPTQTVAASTDQDRSLLEIATHLARLCGGKLDLAGRSESFWATVSLPVIDGLTVLVIDDNEDILHLLERYAMGTRYCVVGTTEPDRAQALAIEYSARVIVLDVMMPKIDGWELLGRLRQHPQTAHIPVVISTILAQEELALSLGASAHLMKPISQESFLETLDRMSANLVPESRSPL